LVRLDLQILDPDAGCGCGSVSTSLNLRDEHTRGEWHRLISEHSPDLVIVTGAGRGIGRSIAVDSGKAGIQVLCISRSENAAATAAAIRQDGGSADSISVDLSDFDEAGGRVGRWLADKKYKRIGMVLAAATLGPSGSLENTSLTEWDLAWRVNVLGNLAVVQAALPSMLQHKFGRLVFFAGGGSAYAYPLFPAYAATKTAIVRGVENLHEDLKDRGDFTVAILAPGAVETDILAAVREQGGYVRTTVAMEEPVSFVRQFLLAESCAFSGCFVHVRDEWAPLLNSNKELARKDLWKLRRIE
jgi:NAD(P)-dependent dehydrogenase (short-subunit alcohol dehydrogenase family)